MNAMFTTDQRLSTDSSPHDKQLESEPFLNRKSTEVENALSPVTFKKRLRISLIIVVQCIILGVSLSFNAVLWFSAADRAERAHGVYSPVHDAIRFHDVVYASGFRSQVTKFQGPPTVEVEQAWEELYPSTITRISAIEAAKLVNKTVRIPDDPENYLVSIDVFHQMHCLNIIRKKVWGVVPDTYVEEKMLELEHVDHCVDSIRQSLMCSGDVTPLPWKWGKNETDGTDLLHPEAHVVHTCRDWTSLIQWAKDRKVVKLTRNKRPVEEKRET